ncbi:hypothetical protein QBC33DRAFT_513905 [Phialemonium atrogriseum]|uniref:MARVEL domain-containing protein n=1 Tax=Phialemonium atrogriseum TaxID=1093897 RepID=A0AAJ0C301_9PEZI|nr:uncharacterized protein QBC33DRAFT_513905 [Phialemonium atrogriseum]KAK1769000.1 hypothetical protein QBC33DRAFT_513905 [Phialemonium atrogriseum]
MGLFGMAASYLAFSVLHFFQFILAVTVCALYGVDLHRASSEGGHHDGKWIYAEVVGGLSALTALLYFIPFIIRFAAVWIWNAILFILWIALFGLVRSEVLKGHTDSQRTKNAVWVVLASALLWLITGLGSFAYWWRHRERHTRFTGRGKV